jgi:hypothetical protein
MLAEWADSREGQGRPLVPKRANSGMSNLGQWTDGRPTKARKEHHNAPGVLDGNATNSAKAETGEGRGVHYAPGSAWSRGVWSSSIVGGVHTGQLLRLSPLSGCYWGVSLAMVRRTVSTSALDGTPMPANWTSWNRIWMACGEASCMSMASTAVQGGMAARPRHQLLTWWVE